ncbi:hypothetical protein [uncultured Aquitalea sp.]|uniref:hypothetical protein n=1 Tax=uncultured Aquitalea sp. TaxID=540272 RepID=UPI0025F22D93|nr:hypothetical protein [uncultured Aquitalea sp.]
MIWLRNNFKLMALLTALGVAVWFGFSWKGNKDTPVITAVKADASAARGVTVAVQAARVAEHKVAASDTAASEAYQKGIEDGKKDLQGSIDHLRAAIRLRDQQLADARARDLPGVPGSAGGRDGPAGSDFFEAHGEDALRLAAEADAVVKQLTACQHTLQGRE